MGEDSKYCSNCKKSVSCTNFTVHTVHCQKNIISCSLCREPVPKSQYQQHVETAHSSIPCPSCGIHVEAVKLFCHQKDLCPKRQMECKFCELEVSASDFEKHIEFCGARTELCKGCTKYVQFKHLQFHYENDHKYLSPEEKEKAEADGSEGDGGEECPVCLGPVTLPLALQCGHVFCMVCVKGIANTTKNCAICRRDIQRDMLMDIRFCREEDIIKNYVTNSKYRKTSRSKSVPSRRVGVTTEDYDEMVSALLSSRTSLSAFRYQRPNNGHTPTPYTPYCYASSCTTTTTTSSATSRNSTTSSSKDDCCCSSSSDSHEKGSQSSRDTCKSAPPRPNPQKYSSPSSSPTSPISGTTATTTTASQPTTSRVSVRRSVSATPSASLEHHRCRRDAKDPESSEVSEYSSTSIPPAGNRPRRPTSLALHSGDSSGSGNAKRNCPPQSLSQEEYDRWLAFQLAQTEDDVSAAEFNKIHRSPFRRSRSMPERKEANGYETETSTKDSQHESNEGRNEVLSKTDCQSRLPPTSPRCSSATPASSTVAGSSSTSRGSNLTKSSSDSSATGNVASATTNSSSLNTGARPKSSTGLKKRVSFKEDAPPVRREAPVMLPCEFCEEMFAERDLMRHQTSCDQNETKNPREYLLSRRSSVTSPVASPTSPISPPPASPAPPLSVNAVASSRPPPSSSPSSRSSESPAKASLQTRGLRTPPQSPSLRHRLPPSPISPPRSPSTSASPQLTSAQSEGYDSSLGSRHTSISPGSVSAGSSSVNGASSGISSISSSSVSTTPSTSSSASPVPAAAQLDTPTTDIEADFEDEEPYFRPRKGRLLSSAITSWRSISGSKTPRERAKYTRSNTAPLEGTRDEDLDNSRVTTCHSATLLQSQKSQDDSEEDSSPDKQKVMKKNCSEPQESSCGPEKSCREPQSYFIKNKNKYKAPQPPKPTVKNENREDNIQQAISGNNQVAERQRNERPGQAIKSGRSTADATKGNIFNFDSVTVMNGNTNQDINDVIPCEFCKKVFPPEKFRDHQAVCEAESKNDFQSISSNHSTKRDNSENKENQQNIPSRRNNNNNSKGPAPKPPKEIEIVKKKNIERSQSVRERSSSEYLRRREFETSGNRIERASSIKERSRYTRTTCDSPPSRWLSREGIYSSCLDCSAAYTGGASLTSSTTSLNSYSGGNGWASHVNMIREEVRSLRPSTAIGGSGAFSFFGTSRYRDRSINRHRPSSLYNSRTTFKLISDALQGPRDKGRLFR